MKNLKSAVARSVLAARVARGWGVDGAWVRLPHLPRPAAAIIVAGALASTAIGSVRAQQASMQFDIAAQPLAAALGEFGRQAAMQILFDEAEVTGRQARAVNGSMPPREALERLLAGTGVGIASAQPGGFSLKALNADPASTATGDAGSSSETDRLAAVTVRAEALRDGTTEDTGSYTTNAITIGKTAQSLRQTPQSVSVVTRQQIEDLNVTEVGQALDYVTGITIEPVASGPGNFLGYARGNNVTFQVDGTQQNSSVSTSVFDIEIYDRVEVQRGPAGMLSGGRLDGAMVNLARKRPHAERRIHASVGGGTYGKHREVLDITGALTESKALSGRLILLNEDGGDWHRNSYAKKKLIDGSLAFKLDAKTTLLAGGTLQDADFNGSISIPTFADGTFPDISVRTGVAAPWGDTGRRSSDIFSTLEHRLDGGGLLRATVRRTQYRMHQKRIALRDPAADDGTVRLYATDNHSDGASNSIDLLADLPFRALGREYRLLFGFDAVRYTSGTRSITTLDTSWPGQLNIFNVDPASLVEPDWSLSSHRISSSLSTTKSYGAYGSVRFKPLDRLTLLAGGRLSWWETESLNRLTDAVSSAYKVSSEFTPYGGLIYDLSRSLSLYASYAEIFVPQNSLTVNGEQIKPRTGGQWEMGIKGEWLDGRLNAHTAFYRIEDSNRALSDPDNAGYSIAAGKVRVEGMEAEISGALLPRWNLTAGYAYTKTEYMRGTTTQTGQPYAPNTPRHNFKLWSNYRFSEAGAMRGTEIGGGIRAVSNFHSAYGTTDRRGPGYVIASIRAAYRINPKLQLALNLDNLFDKRYIQSTGGSYYFGAPRTAMVTLRGSW
ncbi:MAG: TonB-dependent siderophore receptor [Burkholderiaceae bacterium]